MPQPGGSTYGPTMPQPGAGGAGGAGGAQPGSSGYGPSGGDGGAGGSAPAPGAAPAQGGNVVTVQNHAYTPATLTVRVGTTVRWVNRDTDAHSATGNGFDVELPPGGEGSYTFSAPGTFEVRCRYHGNMRGQIVVQ
jgi:plastocyanin